MVVGESNFVAKKDMKVALFGATGIVGNAVLRRLLDSGYDVNVLTRHPEKITYRDFRLNVVVGEVTDRSTVERTLAGCEAVIQTLGIGGKGNGQKTTIVSESDKIIIGCMDQLSIKRYIAISVIGAGDSMAFLPGIYRNFIMPLFQRWFIPIIDDKNRMESDIVNSDLDWTIVRGTTVRQRKPTGHVTASLDGRGLKFSITADDLAWFMVDMITDSTYLRQSPTVSN